MYKCKQKLPTIAGPSAPSVKRAALQLGWIDDDVLWLDMLDDRNRTSHTYNEQTAEAIFNRLPSYHNALQALAQRLQQALQAP